MAVRTQTTIFNAALLRCGRSETTEGEGSDLWRAMEANYDDIVLACFEDADWSVPFGHMRKTLTSRSDGDFGYDDAFSLSSDIIHIREVYLDDCAASDLQQPWEIDGQNRKLMIDAGSRTISIDAVKRGLEYMWSAGFAHAVQRRLEAVIKDVEEEMQESVSKDEEADIILLKASAKGSKNRSKSRVFKKGGGRLSRARFTRTTRTYRGRS